MALVAEVALEVARRAQVDRRFVLNAIPPTVLRLGRQAAEPQSVSELGADPIAIDGDDHAEFRPLATVTEKRPCALSTIASKNCGEVSSVSGSATKYSGSWCGAARADRAGM